MIAILSPAKKLDFTKKVPFSQYTPIVFPEEASSLAETLKKYSSRELMDLMNISSNLAKINAERFQRWQWPYDERNGRQAVYAFNGEAYNGLNAYSMNSKEIKTAQKQLRIISGLYGLLRPLDLILPYRLEMGTNMPNEKGKNLYEFWNNKITSRLNEDLKKDKHKVLVNLASQEYFKAINPEKIDAEIITPVFKENKNGTYKVISVYAKKARGMMSRFIIQNQLSNKEELQAFDRDGYYFNNELSKGNEMVFTRH